MNRDRPNRICQECQAVVPPMLMRLHEKWHRDLRKEIAEARNRIPRPKTTEDW